MIELLAPLISITKLLSEGLKSLRKQKITGKKREFQKAIVSIQLLLEDIIRNAQEILSIVERRKTAEELDSDEINRLVYLCQMQLYNINLG